MSDGLLGSGTLFMVHDGGSPGELVEVAEVTDFPVLPGASVTAVDVTHNESPEGVMEATPGLADPDRLEMELNFLPGSAADVLVQAWVAQRRRRPGRIILPNAAAMALSAFPLTYTPAAPANGRMTANLALKVSGQVAAYPPPPLGMEYVTHLGQVVTDGGEPVYAPEGGY